ncbi:MAG: hypothetical protein Q9193_006211, partial [Seirophora villosa]
MSRNIILASSGIGALTASALANAGHTVYAGMRSVTAESASVEDILTFAKENSVDIRPPELDVINEASVQSAISRIVSEIGQIDILIHNAGHLAIGPSEAFTPKQIAMDYDINCIGTQRVNGAALPRAESRQGSGHL